MATFFDDFERANGALGGNWANQLASATISGGFAMPGASGALCTNSTISDAGRHTCKIVCGFVASASGTATAIVKYGSSVYACYGAWIFYSAPNYSFILSKGNSGQGTTLAAVGLGTSLPFQWTIELTYDQGHLTATCLGQTLTADDIQYAGGTLMGFYGLNANVRIASFQAVTGSAPAFLVSPLTIGNYGSPSPMTASGTNTAWTPGTPGAPAFTVDHGSISAQVVDTSSTAHWTYDPGLYLGNVVFTDPSTGATCGALVTSNPQTVPVGGVVLSKTALAYIERSAAAEENAYIANRTTNIATSGPNVELVAGLASIRASVGDSTYVESSVPGTNNVANIVWQLLSAGYERPAGPYTAPSSLPIAHALDVVRAAQAALITGNEYTLGDVVTLITGLGVPTIADVLTAIAALEVGGSTDLTPVTDAIAALRGDTTTTVAQLLDSLGQIRTTHTYTLGSVVDAIGGLNNASNVPVLGAIAAMGVAVAASFATEEASVAAVGTEVAGVGAGVVGLAATLLELGGAIAQILELLQALPTTSPTVGAPAWPGLALVTLGESVPLAAGLTITTPMHGVLVEVTGAAAKQMFYTYDDARAYRHIGALAFATDRGDLENWQALGFTSAIYCPRLMSEAGAVKVMSAPGTVGTVTPWLRSS